MAETLLVSVLIIAIAVALLCVKLIVRKGGRFTSMHIHDSEAMRERGIGCAMEQDREARMRCRPFASNAGKGLGESAESDWNDN